MCRGPAVTGLQARADGQQQEQENAGMSAGASGMSLRKAAVVAVIALAAIAVALLPAPPNAPNAMIGFAIVLAAVALWATAAVSTLIAGLLFFALAFATQIAPPLALLSGFWSNAAGLVFGGFVIGAAAERSGLGRYVARGLLQRFMSSYPRFIFGILIGTGALSFLVPSTMGRLAITLPIITAATQEAGYAPGSRGYVGAIATAVAGNFLTSFAVLPGNLTNVIALGALEAIHGPQTRYAEYLLLCGPVLGLAKALLFWLCVIVLLPAPAPAAPPASPRPLPLSGAARRLAVLLACTILLWSTDFIHGVKPGAVAVLAAILCLLPPISLANLKESFDLNKVTALLSLGAVLGVATVLIHSGAGVVTSGLIGRLVPLDGHSASIGFAAVSVLSSLISIPATVVGSVAIMTPVLDSVAASTGLPVKLGLIAEMTGLQMVFFPYQTVPIMVGLTMGRVPAASVLRLMIPLALLSLVVILPAQILWLKLIGYLP
jgi:di/tricarboxylate transporter